MQIIFNKNILFDILLCWIINWPWDITHRIGPVIAICRQLRDLMVACKSPRTSPGVTRIGPLQGRLAFALSFWL
jgi:hypothetical protein